MEINRRRFTSAALCAAIVPLASSEVLAQDAQAVEARRVLMDAPSFELLFLQMNTLQSLLALAEIRIHKMSIWPDDRIADLQLRGMVRGSRAELLQAISDDRAQGRIKEGMERARAAIQKLPGTLVEAGVQQGAVLQRELVQAFTTFNLLTTLAPSGGERWWCKVFGLELLC